MYQLMESGQNRISPDITRDMRPELELEPDIMMYDMIYDIFMIYYTLYNSH